MRTLGAVLVAAFGALTRSVVRRLLSGPFVPTWTWPVELRWAVLRAVLTTPQAGEIGHEMQRRIEARIDPPPPRSLRNVLRVERTELAGRPADWIRIVSAPHMSASHMSDSQMGDQGSMLYLHGGAYVAGSPGTHRGLASRLAWASRTSIVLLDYRLAPEHRFPAAVDDAAAAYRALLDDGVDPASLFVAGDSAGGGLAAALLLRLRDEGVPQPAGAVLFSPYADLSHSGSTRTSNALTDLIPPELGGANLEYAGDGDVTHPWASPVNGNWRGVAPLLVFAGGVEILLDDALRLAERAEEAGVDVRLVVEPFMFHGWPAVVPEHDASKRTIARAATFVAEHSAMAGAVEATAAR